MAYYEGNIADLGGGCNNNNGFGNGWEGLIGLALVAGLFDGGFGFGGGNRGGYSDGALTRGELCQDMNFNDLQSAVRGISQGICDSTYALNNAITGGFAGVQQTLCQGFGGVNTSILTSSNALSAQLASCCCELGRGQDRISCEIANSANATIQAGNANTQRILDFLCNEKISALQAENSLLTAQLSQNSQTNTIINALRPVAQPAYITCSPFESAYGFYGNRSGYGNNNCGCGCGCGCNN